MSRMINSMACKVILIILFVFISHALPDKVNRKRRQFNLPSIGDIVDRAKANIPNINTLPCSIDCGPNAHCELSGLLPKCLENGSSDWRPSFKLSILSGVLACVVVYLQH